MYFAFGPAVKPKIDGFSNDGIECSKWVKSNALESLGSIVVLVEKQAYCANRVCTKMYIIYL